jgi:hypothetical protein
LRVAVTESGPMKVLAALDGGAAAAGLSLPQPLVAPPSDGWVAVRLGACRANPAQKWTIALHKPLEAFLSQSKEEATTITDATTGWSASCTVKKHKTNVIAAQSAPNGPERGPNRAVSPG